MVNVAEHEIGAELDSGRVVTFNPVLYPHIDSGWSTTTQKSQGRGDPIVIPTHGRNDDARSAHVSLTRCEVDLRVHTRMERDEMLAHLTSPASLQPKDDSLLFAEIVQRTGGPDTYWAKSVIEALSNDAASLRQEHRAQMRKRGQARERSMLQIFKRYGSARRDILPNHDACLYHRGRRELIGIYEHYALEAFVIWAAKR